MIQIEDTRRMEIDDRAPVPQAVAGAAPSTADVEVVAEDELLIEDVSIDGMCGVY